MTTKETIRIGHDPRWPWLRDVILVLLSVAIIALVVIIGRLESSQAKVTLERTEQISELSHRVDVLTREIQTKDATASANAVTIRRLTAEVIRLGGDPARILSAPVVSSSAPAHR